MKKFIVYLMVIILAVSLGFAVFYLVRDNEVISISSASIYKDAGDSFQIDVNHQNKKSYTSITVSTSNANVVSYDKTSNTFKAENGGVARINFRTTNAKFRNLWCDVIVGDGTMESPFYISTPEQLASIGMGVENAGTGVYFGSTKYNEKYSKYSSDKCYKLVADIDVKDVNEGYWIPLREFSGRFDGNGFTISNLNIDKDNYKTTFENSKDYDPNIFSSDYVGLFQKVTASGLVYNFKLSNVYASGMYGTFGVITAENRGVIERIEVEDAYLSVETEVFGGLVGNNITTEEGENDNYIRNIARIDRCSINMIAGKKFVSIGDEEKEVIKGMNGVVGGLVGNNNGGTVVYSYSTGEVAFGSDSSNAIIYGGIIGNNSYIALNKFGGSYISKIQGGNIKDCYSNLKTNFDCAPVNSNSLFAGAIASNVDYSDSKYDNKTNEDVVHNYIVGVYYNLDNLNIAQENITKNYTGIASFKYNSTTINFTDEKKIVYGLKEEDMKIGDNYISHSANEIEFDENGVSLGLKETNITWLFGSVWAIDNDHNEGKPYLNYQLIYIPDDFITAGTPVVINNSKYMFEKAEVETKPTITSGTNGNISMQVGETYTIKVTPAGLKYTWISSDSTIASVDAYGKVTALKEGRVTITVANKSGITDTVTVTITAAPETITGLPSEINLKVNETYTLSPVVSPIGTAITYKSDDINIAHVSSAGLIKGISDGSTYVYVYAGVTSARVKVNVFKDTSVKIVTISLADNGTSVAMNGVVSKVYSGSPITGKVTAIANYNSTNVNSQVTYSYTSDNPNILTIDNNGNYVISGSGVVNISVGVSGNGYLGSAGFRVSITTAQGPDPVVDTLQFNVNSYSLYVGQSFTLIPVGTSRPVNYSTMNSRVATVNANGVVTGVSAGSTSIVGYIVNDNNSRSYATCLISVMNKVQKTITISPKSSSLEVGKTIDLYATLNAENANDSITWACYPSTYATMQKIDNNHVRVTVKNAGNISVTATSGNVSATASILATDPNAYSKYIYNADQLNAVRHHLDKDFVIADNIDLSGWKWVPIGTSSKPFTGNITSNGNYTIYNINVEDNYEYAGLFGYVRNANISKINITDANIAGDYVGAIAGFSTSSNISNCSVANSTLIGKISTGGIVGRATNSAIDNCRVNGGMEISTISGKSGTKYAGGIAGMCSSTSITNGKVVISGSISLGSSTSGYAGGIVGYTNSSVETSLVDANISANSSDNDYAGGIVGYTTSTIRTGVVRNSVISGHYAGGIGGALNNTSRYSIYFSDFKHGYRKSDISSSNYSSNVSKIAVKDGVTIKGEEIGGLFGLINSGVVTDSYTRANLKGASSKSIKGGFASSILSSGLTNAGGSGNIGIVENCYSACTFDGTGKNFSITQSYVHNPIGSMSIKANDNRPQGFCFNYLFDNDLDGNATYFSSGNIFSGDNIGAKQSSKNMKTSGTYTNKGFNSSIWNLSSGYATLRIESNF